MTTTTDYLSILESWLPDSLVKSDLRAALESAANHQIELDSGTLEIPPDCHYEVTGKALINQQNEIGFGNCFRVVVAIGGVSSLEHGIPVSRYCFATVWYSLEKRVITIDYSREFR